MKTKTSGDKSPTANLAINRSRVKKYGKNDSIPSYYLEKGQEFQIELYNPTQDKVLTTIKLNNTAISGGLVLRPGERVFLDRFLDTNKKFLFDTYTVENTKSSKNAIEPNGDVEIAFFKEIKSTPNPFLCGGTGSLNLGYSNANLTGGNMTFTSNSTDSGYYLGALDSISGEVNINYSQSTISQNMFTPSCRSAESLPPLKTNPIKSKSINFLDMELIRSAGSEGIMSKKTITPIEIETGRVEKGSESDQDLREATGDFELMSFHVVTYKLLPKSEKQLTSADYYSKYCTNCGGRCKTPFCPFCGNKQ